MAVKDMQAKTTLRFHLIPAKTVIIKNMNNNILAKMWGKGKFVYCGGYVN
jgi:hypothetical protein